MSSKLPRHTGTHRERKDAARVERRAEDREWEGAEHNEMTVLVETRVPKMHPHSATCPGCDQRGTVYRVRIGRWGRRTVCESCLRQVALDLALALERIV